MALLVSLTDTDIRPWLEVFEAELGDMDIKIYPDVGDPCEIEYVAAWQHPFSEYKKYLNLKAILSLGAGVDHITRDPELPSGVPIVRMSDDALTRDMCLYALHWVLYFHSDYYRYVKQQSNKQWLPQDFVAPRDRTIGIMGFGNIGKQIAELLVSQGFKVVGWGASEKHETGLVEYFYGKEQMSAFFNKTEILINVLPLTDATRNRVTESELHQLPQGAFVINMGRGCIVNEDDLLSLLDSGHIAAAVLDVFDIEPLPDNNPLWSHPNVTITPHIAGQSDGETAAMFMVDNIRRIERGEAPFPLYDPVLGY
jgi:glyoxylate/hydroxypyruvate reductase A